MRIRFVLGSPPCLFVFSYFGGCGTLISARSLLFLELCYSQQCLHTSAGFCSSKASSRHSVRLVPPLNDKINRRQSVKLLLTSLFSDSTLYSHYSNIATVSGNWGLNNLGRGDVNKTMGNVFEYVSSSIFPFLLLPYIARLSFAHLPTLLNPPLLLLLLLPIVLPRPHSFVAKAIGFRNTKTSLADEPITNTYKIFPGPLNPSKWITFTAPAVNSSRYGGKTLTRPGLDWSITKESEKPINITFAVSWTFCAPLSVFLGKCWIRFLLISGFFFFYNSGCACWWSRKHRLHSHQFYARINRMKPCGFHYWSMIKIYFGTSFSFYD